MAEGSLLRVKLELCDSYELHLFSLSSSFVFTDSFEYSLYFQHCYIVSFPWGEMNAWPQVVFIVWYEVCALTAFETLMLCNAQVLSFL